MFRDIKLAKQELMDFFSEEIYTKKINDLYVEKIQPHYTARKNYPKHYNLNRVKKEFRNLSNFIELIEDKLNKFEYGRHEIEYWKANYILPDKKSLSRYWKSVKEFYDDYTFEQFSDLHINTSTESIESWLSELIEAIKKSNCSSHIITGDVGSGKSTFVKFVLNRYQSFFSRDESKVIPTRLEYRKLREELKLQNKEQSKENTLKLIQDTILQNSFRDIVLICCGNGAVQSTISDKGNFSDKNSIFEDRVAFTNFFLQYQNDSFEPEDEINKIYDYIVSDWAGKLDSLKDIHPEALSIVIEYASEKKYKFLVIFDGFDLLNLYNSVKSKQLNPWFLNMRKLLQRRNRCFLYTRINYSLMAIVREDTYTVLNVPDNGFVSITTNQVSKASIFPPSASQLVDHFLASSDLNLSFPEKSKIKNVFLVFAKHYLIKPRNSSDNSIYRLENLFNNNTRRFLNFFKKVFVFLICKVDDEIPDTELKKYTRIQLLTSVQRMLLSTIKYNEYRINHLLLSGLNSDFTNEMSIGCSSDFVYRVRHRDGFIDNIFDYYQHEKVSSRKIGCISTILKYFILMIIKANEGRRISWYIDRISNEKVDKTYINKHIILLIKAGFIRTTPSQALGQDNLLDKIHLHLHSKGKLVLDHYCSKFEYLVTVFKETNFPKRFFHPDEIFTGHPGLLKDYGDYQDWKKDSFKIILYFYYIINSVEKYIRVENDYYRYSLASCIKDTAFERIDKLDEKSIDFINKTIKSYKKIKKRLIEI